MSNFILDHFINVIWPSRDRLILEEFDLAYLELKLARQQTIINVTYASTYVDLIVQCICLIIIDVGDKEERFEGR